MGREYVNLAGGRRGVVGKGKRSKEHEEMIKEFNKAYDEYKKKPTKENKEELEQAKEELYELCFYCGKRLKKKNICQYCENSYCDKHYHPEDHLKYCTEEIKKKVKKGKEKIKEPDIEPEENKKSIWGSKILTITLILLLIIATIVFFNNYELVWNNQMDDLGTLSSPPIMVYNISICNKINPSNNWVVCDRYCNTTLNYTCGPNGYLNCVCDKKKTSNKEDNKIQKEIGEEEYQEPDYNNFETGKKEIYLSYNLNGEGRFINYTVYKGLNDYLAELPRGISYYYAPPTKKDFALKKIDNEKQRDYLLPLVEEIKKITEDKEDQARVAVSLVQQIPYDQYAYETRELMDRYPYEVLYDKRGVCGEKSKLGAFLLRELGFGVALFNYENENHQSLGIKCPEEYDYLDSGYCFVETSSPTIITDSRRAYLGVGDLLSKDVEVTIISDGDSLDSVEEEYLDAMKYHGLVNKGTLTPGQYSQYEELVDKYGLNV